ncbi:MAG: hypothetical protein NVSMB32_07920 [Actinomycetota bacterium]
MRRCTTRDPRNTGRFSCNPENASVSMNAQEISAQVARTGWYHSIDLGEGVVTPGLSKSVPLAGAELPDFKGRSVLDIGAWDGYYSFLAERQGARRVVALDHYVWCLDFGARQNYWAECRAQGKIPDLGRDLTDFWHPDAPGRLGFDIAHEVLASKVEPVIGDFMTLDLATLGTFDVVLFLGVLYHLKDPIAAVERLRQTAKEVVVIETEAIRVEGHDDSSLMAFYPGDELGSDYGNWYAPTEAALHGLCRAAGFTQVKTVRGHNLDPLHRRWHIPGHVPGLRHYRLTVHAFP